MPLLSCPKPETLLQFVSIRRELPWWKQVALSIHSSSCHRCQETLGHLKQTLDQFFCPEPDVTSSLLRVYSRLRTDETLILKGWKLGVPQMVSSLPERLWANGWIFRGSVIFGALVISLYLLTSGKNPAVYTVATQTPESTLSVPASNSTIPYAKIRIEDGNQVQVHYVRPELLQSVEFQTMHTR